MEKYASTIINNNNRVQHSLKARSVETLPSPTREAPIGFPYEVGTGALDGPLHGRKITHILLPADFTPPHDLLAPLHPTGHARSHGSHARPYTAIGISMSWLAEENGHAYLCEALLFPFGIASPRSKSLLDDICGFTPQSFFASSQRHTINYPNPLNIMEYSHTTPKKNHTPKPKKLLPLPEAQRLFMEKVNQRINHGKKAA